ncbi:thiosulfate oxidation carrier complex protein SoxZ [Methylomonas sp. AM2-LC]|uniref:thiosulfate oxidation carrier complex protein SoxZ n=1 Tax=Methylomonas sp. AM2-LC TaxID=3153301 RepID=UPI003263C327
MTSIKIRTETQGSDTELRLLIMHPMENGRNRDPLTNDLIPAHFITELTVMVNAEPVLEVDMGGSMAKNPFFSFRLKNLQQGDKLSVSWVDNQLNTDRNDHLIE